MGSKHCWWRTPLSTLVAVAIVLVWAPGTLMAGGEAEEVDPEVWAEHESPMLAALVEAGELPPLEERLPENPKVFEPHDEIGEYGGSLRGALVGTGDTGFLDRIVNQGGFVRWNATWDEVLPFAVADYQISEDVTEFTFELRRGLRWSDGEPLTTADVEFYFEHDVFHEELSPTTPSWITGPDGEAADLAILDEETFRITFGEPNGLFLEELSAPGAPQTMAVPRHYAEQFHIEFNDEAEELALDDGYDDWMSYYDDHVHAPYTNAELPTMNPWTVVEGAEYTGEHMVIRFERNPYYYLVDSDGNQLPYVDEWEFDLLEDAEVLLLRTAAGEYDLVMRHITTVDNRPVLYDNRERGDYRLAEREPGSAARGAIRINYTYEDETWQELIHNKDFRIGLSHAIDREEVSEILHAGMTEPRQPAPSDQMPWYNEQLAYQYIEYDPDLAREHFAEAGLEYDSDGNLLDPAGDPVVIPVDLSTANTEDIQMMELVQSHWRQVGVDLELNVIESSLLYERRNANQHHANLYRGTHGFFRDILTRPAEFVPTEAWSFGPAYTAWWNQSLAAEVEPQVPPEPMQRQFELYDQLPRVAPEDQVEIVSEILQIAADEFWRFGVTSDAPSYDVVSNRVGNYPPEPVIELHLFPFGSKGVEQLYIRNE